MTYNKCSGYIFAISYDGITQLSPDPKQVGMVSTAAAGMQSTAQSMTASGANARATASQSTSSNVGAVAAAAEELSSLVFRNLPPGSLLQRDPSKAVGDAEPANATVQVLSAGAEKIGEIVKLIH